jgi:Na+-driven multidrug efflux pump
MYISIISQICVPLGIVWLISTLGTLEPLHIWLAILAGHMTRAGLSVGRFAQGKWRGIVV